MKSLKLMVLACAMFPFAQARATLDRPFNEYTWLTAHNAFANAPPLPPASLPNQTLSLRRQLELGVRGLMLDVEESHGRVRLCHGRCIGLEPTLADVLNYEVLPFMLSAPYAIVTLHLEDRTHRAALAAELAQAPAVAELTFNASSWSDAHWPTPREMADAGQRLIIFTQNIANTGALETPTGTAHILHDRDYTSENYWSLGDTIFTHDRSCVSRWDGQPLALSLTYGPRAWPRLFVMNHFHGAPFGNHSVHDNSYDSLRSRVDDHCLPAAGRKPNYVAVDFVEAGQAASVVAALNTGTIEFFDEPEGKGERVCAVAAGARRTVLLDEHAGDRCPPHRIRSAVLRDIPAGTRVELADGAGHAAARTLIAAKRDLYGERALVRDTGTAQDDAHISVTSSPSGLPKGVRQVTFSQPRQ